MSNLIHIPTTLTTFNKVKKAAKSLVKTIDIKHLVALEKISKELGYDNWNHLHYCFKLSEEKKQNV